MPTRRRSLARLGAAGAAALLPPWAAPAQARTLNGFDLRDALVPADAIEAGGPPRDGIPAIDRPRFVDAARSGLRDDDRVLGLVRGGIARAYPVRILNWHEIVNDRLGDDAVAVTYCPLCGTGMAFDARVGGGVASFGVSGLLYNSDVLLYDRGTESLWSQIMARAVAGTLKGTALQPLPLTHTSWAGWRQRHPRGEVLSTDTGHQRDYDRDPYASYAASPALMFDVQHRDERLPAKAWVLGLTVGGEAKAYPFDLLAQRVGPDGRLDDRVGGRRVRIRYDAAQRSAEAFDAEGRALPAVAAFWFAWVAFHPRTQLLAPR
ncbi:MAG: DUF3179 domain-containing protein [Burkholderiales bacterium]|nr:DUF3179 domain-containing protein [Burkholderiales bacterium]